MGLPAEFDAHQSLVADLLQRPQDTGEIHVAAAEGKVDVFASTHVLDRYRPEFCLSFANGDVGFAITGYQAVAGVEGEAKSVRIDTETRAEAVQIIDGLDEHAGFGFDAERDTAVIRCALE